MAVHKVTTGLESVKAEGDVRTLRYHNVFHKYYASIAILQRDIPVSIEETKNYIIEYWTPLEQIYGPSVHVGSLYDAVISQEMMRMLQTYFCTIKLRYLNLQ